jgi:hypothetical protein
MRVLGTNLPSTQTVHERVFGGMGRGRPITIKPRTLTTKTDNSKPERYTLAWAKIKPVEIERAEHDMGIYMPPGLAPSNLGRVNERRARRMETGKS